MKYALALILMMVSPLAMAATRMPEIDVRGIIWGVVVLVGVAVVFGLLDYAVSKAPFIAEPMKVGIHWFLVAVVCLILIFMILSFIGL